MTHNEQKDQSIENDPERIQMLELEEKAELEEKGIKTVLLTVMFEILRRGMKGVKSTQLNFWI